jgi:hypothetical protein
MSFNKSLQRTLSELPEYREHVEMLLVYKQSCKENVSFRKTYAHLEISANPLDRAKFYDHKKKHSMICKRYHATEKRYKNAAALVGLKDRGINLENFQIAETMGVVIPTSMGEIMRAEKEEKRKEVIRTEMPAQLLKDVEAGLKKWKEKKEQAERISSIGNGVDDTVKFGETI